MSNKKLTLFTGPSGVGKATIAKYLFDYEEFKLKLSISATTRLPRVGEKNGREYIFLTNEEFEEKIKNDEFIEWNEHFSNKYGTLKSEVEKILNSGFNPFLEIETDGAKKIIDKFGDQVISIFIAPPSKEELINRIKKRGSENEVQLKERIARVEEEMSFKSMFNHVIINDDIEIAVKEIASILKVEL